MRTGLLVLLVGMAVTPALLAQEGTIDGPKGVVVNTKTDKIYAVDPTGGNVKVIKGATGAVKLIKTGANSKSIGVDMDLDRIYVINRGGEDAGKQGSLSVIDGKTDEVIDTIVIARASLAAIDPVTAKMYVSSSFSNGIANVVDLKTDIATPIKVGVEGNAIVVDKKADKIYLMGYEDKHVTIWDGATNTTTTVPTDIHLWEGALNESTGKLYLPLSGSEAVTVLDTKTDTKTTVQVGKVPVAVAVNPATNRAYVLNYDSSSVSVLNGTTNAVIATIPTGLWPQALAVNPRTNMIYVANTHANSVTVINGATNKVVATVDAGDAPWSIAVDPLTNKIYAANRLSDQVTVIDGRKNTSVEK